MSEAIHTRPTIMLKKPGQRKGKQQPPKAPETTEIGPPGKKIQKIWAQVGPETHESEPTNRRGEANLRPRGHRETQNKHRTTPKNKEKGNKQPKCTKPANSGSPRGVPKFRIYTTFRWIYLNEIYLVQSHSNSCLYWANIPDYAVTFFKMIPAQPQLLFFLSTCMMTYDIFSELRSESSKGCHM